MSQWSEHSVRADHLSTLGAGCGTPDAFTLSVPSPPARAKHLGPVHENPRHPAGVEGPETFTRVAKQRSDVWNILADHGWHTLSEIEQATGHPQASISARIRDFRKHDFGSHVIERRYVSRGLYEYRLAKTRPAQDPPRASEATLLADNAEGHGMAETGGPSTYQLRLAT